MGKDRCLMTAQEMDEALNRLAAAVIERHGNCEKLALVGIQRRGVDIAARLGKRLKTVLGRSLPHGSLDIALYRDDWRTSVKQPEVLQTDISFSVDGAVLVLVDDVLYTGRTIRAALEALADFGRPSRVELLVLVDRGHRELPIHADYVGLTVPTLRSDRVHVRMQEHDGHDEVFLAAAPE